MVFIILIDLSMQLVRCSQPTIVTSQFTGFCARLLPSQVMVTTIFDYGHLILQSFLVSSQNLGWTSLALLLLPNGLADIKFIKLM